MGTVKEDSRIMGGIYRILWRRDVNTMVGCEEASAAIAHYLRDTGIQERFLWDEKPDLAAIQQVLYPWKLTKMEALETSLLDLARGLLVLSWPRPNGDGRRHPNVEKAYRVAEQANILFSDSRMELVTILAIAAEANAYAQDQSIRMSFGDEIADAVMALQPRNSDSLKSYMDKVVANDLAASVKALYLADDLNRNVIENQEEPINQIMVDRWAYQIGRLRREFSVEIAQILQESEDGSART